MQCKGFKAAGIVAGIKKNGSKDLGCIFSETPATVAGMFTRNRVKAAPVLLDRERVKSGNCRAIIVNSGNANCCTGGQGMQNAISMARLTADALNLPEEMILVSSTGVIGQPMPMEKLAAGIPKVVGQLDADGLADFAEAIMTTDTIPKIVSREGDIGGKRFTVVGVAKGAGMIRPDMATMLSYVCTDAEVSAEVLKESLKKAVDGSFNRMTIDGDTSTNDTVLLLANGQSDAKVDGVHDREIFQGALDEVLLGLAKMLVKDGEGVTKLVEITVKGAETVEAARQMADTIAHSNLVKTAIFGEDANWGRVLAAAGRAGVELEVEKTDLFFDDVQMVANGEGQGETAEAEATRVLKKDTFGITLDLKQGSASASVLTCDFSVDYVKINADYRT
jgi:glutamate N-acetyltransferase / amino-acid N-acetyltransferase